MSRSSGPGTHPAGLPQQRQQPGNAAAQTGWQQPAPQDQQGWQHPAQQAAPNWPTQGHYAQQGYPVQQQQQPAAAPTHDPLARAADYHYPQAADPYAQQRAAPAPAAAPRTAPPAQPQYAPQFDAYVPPSRPTAPPAPQPQPQQAYQHAQPVPQQAHAYAPPQPPAYPAAAAPRQQSHPLQGLQPSAPRAPELRGTTHDQWPQAQPQPQAYQQPPQSYQAQPQADPRGYDLGNYAPTGADHQQPGYEPVQPTYAQPHGDWHHQQAQQPAQQGYAHDAQAYTHGHAQPQLEAGGYHNEQAAGYETGQELVAEQEYAQDDAEYEEEAPRRSKGLIIVAALIGAIGLGGGLAYAYKTFLAPSDKGKVPIVKNDRAPTKVQPPTPGGKQFANTDSKVLNGDGGKIGGRVNDGMGGGSAASASNSLDSDGTKKVQVLEVSRDGQIATPRPSIPGLIVSDGGMGPRPLQAPQPEAAPSPPVQPQRIVAQPRAEPPPAPAAPVVRNQAPPPSVIDAKSAAAARSVTAAAAPAVKQPVATTKMTTSSPGVGSGWVAVLASQRSQGEALQAFADLKQKYPDLLQNRQPGVQEANLGEKGVYHRLVAGPAGSKDDANALCMQLKASGHANCWVTAVK